MPSGVLDVPLYAKFMESKGLVGSVMEEKPVPSTESVSSLVHLKYSWDG